LGLRSSWPGRESQASIFADLLLIEAHAQSLPQPCYVCLVLDAKKLKLYTPVWVDAPDARDIVDGCLISDIACFRDRDLNGEVIQVKRGHPGEAGHLQCRLSAGVFNHWLDELLRRPDVIPWDDMNVGVAH
jgi:hypothetical protein